MAKVKALESESLMHPRSIVSCAASVAACLLFLLGCSSVCGQGSPASSEKTPKINLNGFREQSRILVGKLPVMVTPFREYTLRAGASGEIEMYVPVKTEKYEAGRVWRGLTRND